MVVGLGASDVEDGVLPFRDFEDEDDAGGGGLDGALVVEGQGRVWLPGATDATESFDHFGVLRVAGERPLLDESRGEFNGVSPGLEADQDELLAAADAQLKVAVGEQTRPRPTLPDDHLKGLAEHFGNHAPGGAVRYRTQLPRLGKFRQDVE